jgi:hypothetical protein
MNRIVIVLAAALVTAAAFRAAFDFDHYYGVDYYHFWGVPAAHEAAGGNPYSRTTQYAEYLNRVADASGDPHLRASNRYRREIQPTATPFFYATCALLPHAFDAGYATWTAILFAALIGSVFWMARMQGAPGWPALAIAAAMALTFAPFDDDVKAGNVNSLQLLALVAAIAFARRRIDAKNRIFGNVYFAALGLFVAWKPNTALVAPLLALQFLLTRERGASIVAAGAAIAAAAAAFVIGAGYFDGVGAWSDWSRYVNGHGGTLLYRTEDGSISIPMLMSQRTGGLGPFGYGVMLGSMLVALFIGALAGFGRNAEGLAPRARALLEDPWFAASAGILLTLISAPLVWPHYLVLALIPGAWAWGSHRGWDGPRWLLLAAYALLVLPFALGPGLGAAKSSVFMLGWLPIAGAMAMRLRGPAIALDKSQPV